jgi:hypothetical protein
VSRIAVISRNGNLRAWLAVVLLLLADLKDARGVLALVGLRVVQLVLEPSADGLALTSGLVLAGLRRGSRAKAFR